MGATKIGMLTLAAAGLVLAGCSTGDDPTTPQATSGSDSSTPDDSPSAGSTPDGGNGVASDDLVGWAGNLCTAVGPFEDRFADIGAFQPTDPSDPRGYVEQVQDTFAEMATLFDDARVAVEDGGPPPIDGGDEVYANLLDVLGTAGEAFDEIGAELAAIDPADPTAVTELGTLLANLRPQLEASVTTLESTFSQAELEAAFTAAPECEDLTRS